jgi:hypothetical protein
MATATTPLRLYDDDADELMHSEKFADRVTLLPSGIVGGGGGSGGGGSGGGGGGGAAAPERVRIMWGQDMLRDVLDGRYRAVVCGVNDSDNSHGIVAQLVNLVPSSQWTVSSVTSYARVFQESVGVHATSDREPFVLKFDLDSILILGILRPKGRDHFTLDDLSRGFRTISKMLRGRRERRPVASVSFLNARVNRLTNPDGQEPSFESVLRAMYDAGFRGDIYPAPTMWQLGHVGVFPSFPFPEGLEQMRTGSS